MVSSMRTIEGASHRNEYFSTKRRRREEGKEEKEEDYLNKEPYSMYRWNLWVRILLVHTAASGNILTLSDWSMRCAGVKLILSFGLIHVNIH